MTKIQRQKHIVAINKLLEESGFELNRWGKYHKDELKIDTRETNMKVVRGEHKIFSKPMTGLTLEEVEVLIKRWTNRRL